MPDVLDWVKVNVNPAEALPGMATPRPSARPIPSNDNLMCICKSPQDSAEGLRNSPGLLADLTTLRQSGTIPDGISVTNAAHGGSIETCPRGSRAARTRDPGLGASTDSAHRAGTSLLSRRRFNPPGWCLGDAR